LAKKTGGLLTPDDAVAFEAWLNADRRHRRAFDDVRILYAQLEAPTLRAAQGAPLRRALATRFRPRWGWLFAPAVPVVALLIAWVFNPDIIQNWQADIVASRQPVSVVRLPDGSIARLGADTALSLDFREGRRRVVVLRGEAYFEVMHGPPSVFTVQANGDDVRDMGTKFNVNIVRDQTRVFVTEGAVEVSGGVDAKPVLLRRGNQLVVAAGRARTVQSVDMDLAMSWMSGRLVVQGATVEEVAAALQRHTRGRIFVRGALAKREISGTFPLTDVNQALATVASAVEGTLLHATPLLTVLY
jgi:transmembrane sensor